MSDHVFTFDKNEKQRAKINQQIIDKLIAESKILGHDFTTKEGLSRFVNYLMAMKKVTSNQSKYKPSYIERILYRIKRQQYDKKIPWPLTTDEMTEFIRSIRAHYLDINGHQIVNFTHEQESILWTFCISLLKFMGKSDSEVVSYDIDYVPLIDFNEYSKFTLFAYCFVMMRLFGKRRSDICHLELANLRNLFKYNMCSIYIQKYQFHSRIELFEDRDVYKDIFPYIEQLCLKKILILPFDSDKVRNYIHKTKNFLLTRLCGVDPKNIPSGVGLHNLRNKRALEVFEKTGNIDSVKRLLDHRTTKTTNLYINKALRSLDEDNKSLKM